MHTSIEGMISLCLSVCGVTWYTHRWVVFVQVSHLSDVGLVDWSEMPISDDGSSAAFQSENGCPLLARSSSYPESTTPPSPSQSLTKLDNKKSVRPFRTNDEYLYAMKEDLAAWFNDLYSTNLTAENLLDNLQDGVFLCRHANNVRSYIEAASNSTNVPNITYR